MAHEFSRDETEWLMRSSQLWALDSTVTLQDREASQASIRVLPILLCSPEGRALIANIPDFFTPTIEMVRMPCYKLPSFQTLNFNLFSRPERYASYLKIFSDK